MVRRNKHTHTHTHIPTQTHTHTQTTIKLRRDKMSRLCELKISLFSKFSRIFAIREFKNISRKLNFAKKECKT